MNRCLILVDNTNLFIGGQQLSAERKGAHSNGHGSHHGRDGRGGHNGHGPSDPSWRLDFDGLLRCLARGREVHAAIMVGSCPPDEGTAWEDAATVAGFTVVVHDTNARREEKAVDTELVARGTEIICMATEPMVLVLASGDRDYVPLVEVARRNGWEVELCAFRSSFSRHGELAELVDRVRPLDDCFDAISRYEFDWPEGSPTAAPAVHQR